MGTDHFGPYGASGILEDFWRCVDQSMPDLSGYHVWFEHICAGINPMSNLRIDPEGIAQRLMSLHGSLWG